MDTLIQWNPPTLKVALESGESIDLPKRQVAADKFKYQCAYNKKIDNANSDKSNRDWLQSWCTQCNAPQIVVDNVGINRKS